MGLGLLQEDQSMMKFTFSQESSLNFIPFTILQPDQYHRVVVGIKLEEEMLSIQRGK